MISSSYLNKKTTIAAVSAIALFILIGLFAGKPVVDYNTKAGHSKYRAVAMRTSMQRLVTLTFDDGPDPRYTPRILKILRDEHIHATFFMIGQQVEKYPDLARQVAMDGNTIGNHTYSHPDLKVTTLTQVEQELSKCQDSIYKATGQTPHYFRPPKGLYDGRTIMTVKEDGYEVILWDVAVEHHASHTASREAQRVINRAKPAYIILAHDGRLNREKTVRAIPIIIKGLKNRGYRFVGLDDFIRMTHHQGARMQFGMVIR